MLNLDKLEQIRQFNELVSITLEYDYYFSAHLNAEGALEESTKPHDKNYNAFNIYVNLPEVDDAAELTFGVSNADIEEYAKELFDQFVQLDFNQEAIAAYLETEGFE